jgi:hypothetical protein
MTASRHICLPALIAVLLLMAIAPHAQEQQWRIHREPGLEIQYRPRNATELPRLSASFEALADTSLPVTIHLLVAASRMEFERLTEGMIPEWSAAVAFPSQRLIVISLISPEKPLAQIMTHEVSHIMLGALVMEPVPRWFDEGLAMYLSGEWSIYDSFRLARGAIMSELIELPRIDYVLSFQRDRAWLAYTQSHAAVMSLFERMTDAERSQFMRGLATMPFDEALAVATNIRRSQFEEEWMAGARRRYALIALADDMWIWTVLLPGIFFIALAVRWWRNRKTIQRWKDEDDDDDDGPPDEPLDPRIAATYG